MTEQILRNVGLQPDVYDLVKAESFRRRNGVKGFSLTLNQIVLEWADAHNAELLPVETQGLRDLPAVERVCVPAETEG